MPPSEPTAATKFVENPSAAEMLEEMDKWWDQRNEQLAEAHNLFDQRQLLNTVAGIQQDVTFLLRLVRVLVLKAEASYSPP